MNIKKSSGIFTSNGNWAQVKNPILIKFPSPDLGGVLMALTAESPENSNVFLKCLRCMESLMDIA